MTAHMTQSDDINQSYLELCLRPLLVALKWKGGEALLFESMPHMLSIDDMGKFSWVMKNLGYSTRQFSICLNELSEKNFPCVFLVNDGRAPILVLERTNDGVAIFNSLTQEKEIVSDENLVGIAFCFKQKRDELIKEDEQNWFKEVLFNCKGMFFLVLLLSVLQAILLLLPSAYIMFLYDQVFTAHAYNMLFSFTLGVIVASYFLFQIMNLRSKILGYFGARLQNNIGVVIFSRLLKLQPTFVETASLSRQLSRLADFHQLREFAGGPLLSNLFEIPMIILFLLFIWLIAGVLVLVPLIAMVVYFAVGFIFWVFSHRVVSKSGQIKSIYQNFLIETFGGMRSLQYAGLQDVWFQKFKDVSAAFSLYGKDALFLNSVNESVFNALTMLTGLATLVVGAVLIMSDELKVGALIAVLFVIWRLLSPVKIFSMTFSKFISIRKSIKQVNELMRYPSEIKPATQWETAPRQVVGDIRFDQVAFRYPASDVFILKNASFSVKSGETLLILGPAGSGKTSIANLILNLYPIQGGYIYIDGKNIKQFDVGFLRKNIAFAPEKAEFFYGTIEQNLKFANPLASKAELMAAVSAANLFEEIEQLPEGFDTRIRFYGDYRFGASFCQKMNLARAYLKDASVLVLDDPTNCLDQKNEQIFVDHLSSLKGKKTIVLCEHDTRHIHLADQVIVLYDGYIVASGTPEEVLKNIPKGII